MFIEQIPSPNFGERKGFDGPDMILIHYTGMETAEAAIARLCARSGSLRPLSY